MIILSHRGYWKKESEKNTLRAFERSFSLGFGTETDVRDRDGELVISHDPPGSKCMSVDDFFNLYCRFGKDLLCLALNIKSDGLQAMLMEKLDLFGIKKYFVFDMSVPDTLGYLNNNSPVFSRQSEYERTPAFYDVAEGVWLDEFHSHWIDEGVIVDHINHGKKICIVSPDLHGREYLSEWQDYKNIIANLRSEDIMICTDYPEAAKEFFYAT